MLALAKRIPEADRYTREGKYTGWGPMLFLSPQVSGKTLGLVGAGRIGSRVAEFANMFGMRTVYYDIQQNASLEKLGIEFQPSLDALISEADFISLHVPLLDSTRHLIDGAAFSKMKPTAFLINTSRGPVVDEAALVSALKAGALAGAALDVFEHEPALAPGLLELPNVIATPHIASATSEARSNMSRVAGENILAVLQGEIPPDSVAV
jgi:phosphoglycerate dehydrogenase-like enzyme